MKYINTALFVLFGLSITVGQDARIYYEGTYYNGPFRNLSIGQSINLTSDGDEISIRILNPNAAIKVTVLNSGFSPAIPSYFFVYTERDFPEVFGTDQYENKSLLVECLPKANSWQQMPQPQVYVPFDFTTSNPNSENDSHLKPFVAEHKMLVLRRAFIWENSEDIGGLHGPYGDVKIQAGKANLLGYTDEQLVTNWTTLSSPSNIMSSSDLPGPIWSGYAPAFYPDPYDEWIDGPFGCIYSNIAVWDWSIPGADQSIGVFIVEADSPNSFLGKSQSIITPDMQGEILVKIWGFGFVVLENITVPSGGKETSVAKGDVYWYGGWDDRYPVIVYGPQNPAVPCEECRGSQFRPFTDARFWNFHNNPTFNGYKVGLLGGKYPKGVYNMPRTYYAIDKPVTFGQ